MIIPLLHFALITVSLGTYSLPELAHQLSTPGNEITAAGSLKERGALVALHERSPKDSLDILCKALDLQVVQVSQGTFRLEPKESVESRNRLWRVAAVKQLTDRWSQHQAQNAEWAEMDRPTLEKLEEQMARKPKAGETDDWTTLQMFLQAGAPAKAATLLMASASPDLRAEILTDGIQRDETSTSLPPDLVSQVRTRLAVYGPIGNPIMLQRVFSRYPGNPTSLVNLTLYGAIARDDGWALESVSGVLVVRNRMAFLDRVSNCPVGAIAHYIRTNSGHAGNPPYSTADRMDAGPGLPFVRDILPLVRARTAGGPEWFDYGGYRGLWDSYLWGRSLLLWPGLPVSVTADIRSQRSGKARVSLQDCDPGDVQKVAESMLGPESTDDRRQQVLQMLHRAHVELKWNRRLNGDTRVLMDLSGISDESLQSYNAIGFRIE